jgi:hypothetical protein
MAAHKIAPAITRLWSPKIPPINNHVPNITVIKLITEDIDHTQKKSLDFAIYLD